MLLEQEQKQKLKIHITKQTPLPNIEVAAVALGTLAALLPPVIRCHSKGPLV